MNRKGLAILMRTKMRPTTTPPISPSSEVGEIQSGSGSKNSDGNSSMALKTSDSLRNPEGDLKGVWESMHSAISMSKIDILDPVLKNFSEGYLKLSYEDRRKLLVILAREYDVRRNEVHKLIQQYLGLEFPSGDIMRETTHEEESLLSSFYRIERNLRHALQPKFEVLFEHLNTHPGGLKFMTGLRGDLLSMIAEEKVAALRALDSYLKEKLVTWLTPATLELHHITWDDPASLLEKIVAHEAVHPISNLTDLKRRLGIGRRCFGYLHPAIPGEPLIFIEVALLKDVARTIQEVLWDSPPSPESEATCALFYSISSTQPGLAGINLGKFLIKRVIELVKRDMPHVTKFATLSPIPGYMNWLQSKLASQLKIAEAENEDRTGSTFKEDILQPEEERALLKLSTEFTSGANGVEVMMNLLTSTNYEWAKSDKMVSVLRGPLMRLCARYLVIEKKRGKALDSVANFHLQNGAMIERLNWMADRSTKGLHQSGSIMVNYVYRTDKIEENAQLYFNEGRIQASSDIHHYLEKV
ncbi:hypothetical protein Sjap_003045 [Stephania japonica]|uniref:Malonyl-CoA decarboxylase n=1 Tax=Stephania japonica TaxID=461633 RepID=A0AAP0KQM6_9MAGN